MRIFEKECLTSIYLPSGIWYESEVCPSLSQVIRHLYLPAIHYIPFHLHTINVHHNISQHHHVKAIATPKAKIPTNPRLPANEAASDFESDEEEVVFGFPVTAAAEVFTSVVFLQDPTVFDAFFEKVISAHYIELN